MTRTKYRRVYITSGKKEYIRLLVEQPSVTALSTGRFSFPYGFLPVPEKVQGAILEGLTTRSWCSYPIGSIGRWRWTIGDPFSLDRLPADILTRPIGTSE